VIDFAMNLFQRYRKLTTWNKVAVWGSIASILGLLFIFIPMGDGKDSIQNNRSNVVSGTNISHSISVAGNQTGNNTIVDHSVTLPPGFPLGSNQTPLYAPQVTTINNNYYGTVSNSVTRDAFEALEARVATATNKIELTVTEVQKLARALRDLDQRTSDIEKLPDGRTRFGSVISGSQKVIFEAFQAGVQSLTNQDFRGALEQFTRAIDAIQPEPSGLQIRSDVTLTAEGMEQLYRLASISAQMLGSNTMANTFAEKAVQTHPTSMNRALLATTLANLGLETLRKEQYPAALEFLHRAVDASEASQSAEGFSTNSLSSENRIKILRLGIESAQRAGSNLLANDFAEKAVKADPTDMLSQVVLAFTLSKIGRKDDSAAVIDKFLGAETNNPAAKQLREFIRNIH